jgi:hypothetical protein
MKATIYSLITPDEGQFVYGYRWRIQYYNVSIIGDIIYHSQQAAINACERTGKELNIPVTIGKKIVETHDFDFLV